MKKNILAWLSSPRKIVTALCVCCICAALFISRFFLGVMDGKDERYLEKCEATKAEMISIAEAYIESLNNHDYETFINLHSKGGLKYYKNVDDMYEFLNREQYDFTGVIDYNEFAFKIDEIDNAGLERSFETLEFEEALEDGVAVIVEFGNSEKMFHQKWTFEFVMEDGQLKIFEDIWLSNNAFGEVENGF